MREKVKGEVKREVKRVEKENPDQACHVVGDICPSPSTSSSSTGSSTTSAKHKYVCKREGGGRGEGR